MYSTYVSTYDAMESIYQGILAQYLLHHPAPPKQLSTHDNSKPKARAPYESTYACLVQVLSKRSQRKNRITTGRISVGTGRAQNAEYTAQI